MEKSLVNATCARVCRLCLCSRGEILPLFSSGSDPDSGLSLLASKIHACVSVEITEDDRLPNYVCKKCVNNVNNWYSFKKVCVESQAKLQDWLKNDINIFEKVADIKKEPFFDETNDNEEDILEDCRAASRGIAGANAIEKIHPEGPPILASLGLAPRSEKKNVDPRLDWIRVKAILGLIEADEAVEGSDFAHESDQLEESEHNTDTEDELFSCDEELHETKTSYIGRDGTIWRKKYNNIHEKNYKRKFTPGCIGKAKEAIKPEQAWSCLISDEMLENIVESTNAFIVEKFPETEMLDDVMENTTSKIELRSLFGILYLIGIMRPSYLKHAELWWEDGCGLSAVQNCMTVERFRFLLSCIKFCKNRIDRTELSNKLSTMRVFVDKFTLNCKQSYQIDECVVLDEIIIPFTGPCAFRKKLKNKPIDSGIKIFLLAETNTFYISNLEVSTGCESDFNVDSLVKRMVNHISGSYLTVILDKWYTSLNLARNLLSEHSLYCVGALDITRPEISPVFGNKKRIDSSLIYGYTDSHTSVASYLGTNGKVTTVLSTKPEHCKRNYDKMLPESLNIYKQQKSTIEVISVLTHLYTTAQNTDSWQLALLFFLLDISAINAQVIWLSNRNDRDFVQRRSFLRSLALGLMDDQIKANGRNHSFSVLDPLLSVRQRCSIQDSDITNPLGRTRRCKICVVEYKRRDRKTRYVCLSCKYPTCREHMAVICKYCAPKL